MGLLTGSIGYRSYCVLGEVPANYKDTFLALINRYLFKNFSDETEDETLGWVPCNDTLAEVIGFDEMFLNEYVLLTLRKDTRKVPGNILTAHTRHAVRCYREEHQLERVPTRVRKELHEREHLRLLTKVFPSMQTCDLCWNVSSGRLYFFSSSERMNEDFTRLFQRTFGLEVLPLCPTRLLQLQGLELPGADSRILGQEFLTWLVFKLDTAYLELTEALPIKTECWIDEQLSLRGETTRNSFSGPLSTSNLETKIGVRRGNMVDRLRLGFRIGELEWRCTLTAPPQDKRSVAVPKGVAIEEDDAFYERVSTIEQVEQVVFALFDLFLDVRRTPETWQPEQLAFAGWLAELPLDSLPTPEQR
ncbi:MAG: hypothetical protein A2284_06885 [Deltaproteobacteria bacterium RIFOXYA12_FULL_61_11]|nr:MAG: hypothetical protein A2284_06885 [Deltaproteobacteria bacterium RIFOXYA12_FULL_61_11]